MSKLSIESEPEPSHSPSAAAAAHTCFLCGNTSNYETKLYTRNTNLAPNTPFYPFLEYHEPAPSALPHSSAENSVFSCNMCYMSLYFQWNQHESKNTNIQKRLYWMKRPFGCEIRQPVTQLEIDELLDSSDCGEGDREEGEGEEEEEDNDEPLAKRSKVKNVVKNWKMNNGKNFSKSWGSKKVGSYASSADFSSSTLIYCYLCGFQDVKSSLERVFVRSKRQNDPIEVPSCEGLLQKRAHTKAQICGDGSVYLCESCFVQNVPGKEIISESPNATLQIVRKLAEMIKQANDNKIEENVSEKSKMKKPESSNLALTLAKSISSNLSCSTKNTISNQIQNKIPNQISTKPCLICERKNSATKTVRTAPLNKAVAESCESSLDISQAFFPILATLSAGNSTETPENSNSVAICRICFYNVTQQWQSSEKNLEISIKKGEKSGPKKQERWLRTYFINEAKCCACGDKHDTGRLVEVSLGRGGKKKTRVPKVLLRGLFYEEDWENFMVVCDGCNEKIEPGEFLVDGIEDKMRLKRIELCEKLREFNGSDEFGCTLDSLRSIL